MQRLLIILLLLIWVVNSLPLAGNSQPVFRGLNQTQQTQLHKILFDPNATRSSIKINIGKWVAEQRNQTLQDAYNKHRALKDEWKKLFIEVHNERVSKLSTEAKDLDAKLMGVWQDEKLTIGQTCEQINQLITTAPDFVVKELFREIRRCTNGDPDHFIL